MNFYEIVNAECKKNGITVTELLRQIGLSSANTGAWKSGGFPRVDKLIEISNILNVSIDYLLGRDEKKTEETDFTYAAYDELSHDLSPEQISQLKSYADFLRQQK